MDNSGGMQLHQGAALLLHHHESARVSGGLFTVHRTTDTVRAGDYL